MSRTADAFIEIVEHCYPCDFQEQEDMEDRIAAGVWKLREIAACSGIVNKQLRGFALAQIIHDIGNVAIVRACFLIDEINACTTERDNNSDN